MDRLSQAIAESSSLTFYKSSLSDRPRAPTPSSRHPPMPVTPGSPLIHRTYSARELPSQRTKPYEIAAVSTTDAAQTRSRAMSTSLVSSTGPLPPRPSSSKANLSLYTVPALVTASETVYTPPLPDLPDPNTYPDPYPSYPSRAPSRHNGMTPPMSLFSEGSSSASTRSSLAYNSVYLRSSEGGHDIHSMPDDFMQRRTGVHSQYTADTSFGSHEGDVSMGNLEPTDVGVATTSDEAVHLTHSGSTSSFTSGSRARTLHPVPDSVRWSDTSYGRAVSTSDLRNRNSNDWDDIVEDEREEITTDDDTDAFVDTEDDDEDDDAENDRTAAVLVAEEGLGQIVRGEGCPVDRLVNRQGKHPQQHLLQVASRMICASHRHHTFASFRFFDPEPDARIPDVCFTQYHEHIVSSRYFMQHAARVASCSGVLHGARRAQRRG